MFTSPVEKPDPRSDPLTGHAPTGAAVLCGIAVLVVIGLWFAFYFFAFLKRGITR